MIYFCEIELSITANQTEQHIIQFDTYDSNPLVLTGVENSTLYINKILIFVQMDEIHSSMSLRYSSIYLHS